MVSAETLALELVPMPTIADSAPACCSSSISSFLILWSPNIQKPPRSPLQCAIRKEGQVLAVFLSIDQDGAKAKAIDLGHGHPFLFTPDTGLPPGQGYPVLTSLIKLASRSTNFCGLST